MIHLEINGRDVQGAIAVRVWYWMPKYIKTISSNIALQENLRVCWYLTLSKLHCMYPMADNKCWRCKKESVICGGHAQFCIDFAKK